MLNFENMSKNSQKELFQNKKNLSKSVEVNNLDLVVTTRTNVG